MATTTQQKPIGVNLPIQKGAIGYFDQCYDTFSQVKSNIINLIRTKPGERRMQPLFGCRLHKALFDQKSEILSDYITQLITEDIQNWIPNVIVNKVNVSSFKNDGSLETENIYKIYIEVNYTEMSTKMTDSVNLTIDTNAI